MLPNLGKQRVEQAQGLFRIELFTLILRAPERRPIQRNRIGAGRTKGRPVTDPFVFDLAVGIRVWQRFAVDACFVGQVRNVRGGGFEDLLHQEPVPIRVEQCHARPIRCGSSGVLAADARNGSPTGRLSMNWRRCFVRRHELCEG